MRARVKIYRCIKKFGIGLLRRTAGSRVVELESMRARFRVHFACTSDLSWCPCSPSTLYGALSSRALSVSIRFNSWDLRKLSIL